MLFRSKDLRQTLIGGYIQDGFSISERFQVNAGVRYEFATLIHDMQGRTAFMPDVWHDPEVQVGALLDHNPSKGGISPRLSLTWSPFGGRGTVVRAGAGIYYDQVLAYALDTLKNGAPFNRSVFRTAFDASPYFPDIEKAVTDLPNLPGQQIGRAHV